MLDSLLGTVEIARSNLYLLTQDDIGLVFPQHFADIKDSVDWGNNFHNAKWLLGLVGIEIYNSTLLDFPSGSMIFAKTAALKKLYSLPILWGDFEKEKGQIDATLAHAYERSLLYFCEDNGYKWIKVSTNNGRQFTLAPQEIASLSEKLDSMYPDVLGNYSSIFTELKAEWMLTNNTLWHKLKRTLRLVKRFLKNLLNWRKL